MKSTDEEKYCYLCEHAREIQDEQWVLCQKRGVVARDYHCRRFSLDVFKLSPTPNVAPLFDPEQNFSDILK